MNISIFSSDPDLGPDEYELTDELLDDESRLEWEEAESEVQLARTSS